MSDDYSFDGSGGGYYTPPSNDVSGNPINYTDPLTGLNPGSNPGYNPLYTTSNGITGGITPNVNLGQLYSGAGGGSFLGSLVGALTGSGGGDTSSLLAQLLGYGASGIGGNMQSNAAKNAATTFGDETKFNPYSISTNNGSTSFNGNQATSTLSPEQQSLSNLLASLGGHSASALSGNGYNTSVNNNFNALQSADLQAQQRLMGNTQDNEFANGVLGSTAGGYQTQAALNAIGQQTGQNYSQAVNQANAQQQAQLAQLTGSLNGLNQINQSQLNQITAGGNLGSAASGANALAYQPALAANSNSNIGNLLTSLGSSATNSGQSNSNALAQFIAGLG